MSERYPNNRARRPSARPSAAGRRPKAASPKAAKRVPKNTAPSARHANRARQATVPSSAADASVIGNVGAAARPRATAGAGRPSVARHGGTDVLVSRRNFLYGAVAVGAVAVGAGVAGAAYSSYEETHQSAPIVSLDVPEGAVSTLDDMELVDDYSSKLALAQTVEMKLGTLVWCNDDDVAACLVPTDAGTPLATVSLIALGTGADTQVLGAAVGAAQGFEIYDVRATSQGVVWTEANILDGNWRVYTAPLSGMSLGAPTLADSGNVSDYETPGIAAAGGFAFWSVQAPYSDTSSVPGVPTQVRRAPFATGSAETVFESARRLGAPLYAAEDCVVAAPRTDTATAYYQLTRIDAQTGQVTDQITLPQAMRPLEAGWGRYGFMWSQESIYDYGGGLAQLGTYTPAETVGAGGYDAARWFRFGRTPTAAPAWCGNLLMVKSTYSVCGVDLTAGQYFSIDVDDGADDYGEYLASTGTHNRAVTYTSIDYEPVNAEAVKTCRIKVWEPVSA